MRFYRFERSTNAERVALALAHKELEVESVYVNPGDRSEVRRVSGQDLIPVLVDGPLVVYDSMEIVRYLDTQYPEPPLYPRDPARRAEMDVFIDWFNRVWKRPPNDIEAESLQPVPDLARIDRLGAAMGKHLDLFEELLAGRDFLMGDSLSAADVCAFPFLKYAVLGAQGSSYPFHVILVKWQPLGETHPRLEQWVRRVDRHPRV